MYMGMEKIGLCTSLIREPVGKLPGFDNTVFRGRSRRLTGYILRSDTLTDIGDVAVSSLQRSDVHVPSELVLIELFKLRDRITFAYLADGDERLAGRPKVQTRSVRFCHCQ